MQERSYRPPPEVRALRYRQRYLRASLEGRGHDWSVLSESSHPSRRSLLRMKATAIAALAILQFVCPSPAPAEQLVKFSSAIPRSHQGDGASPSEVPIQGYLTKPKGAGPFPAVVLLHSCLGLPANRHALGNTIAGWGYVALFVDDFATRGLKETCAVDFPEAMPDAFGALRYVSKLPYVDPTRIAAVGYSQGGDTALEVASSRFASAFALPDDLGFKVAAAFYPPCANEADNTLTIPTLILVGELDNVTPAMDCRRLAQSQPAGRVKLVIYPGAHHLFDDPSVTDGRQLLGMWLQYNRSAAQQSKTQLHDFLAATLAQ